MAPLWPQGVPLAALLALCRAGPVGLLLPLPWIGRVALALLGTALLAPALVQPAASLGGHDALGLAALLGREALCGIALGLCAAVPLVGALGAGALLDAARGGPAEPLAGRLLLGLAVALFVTLSGPESLLRALALSYEAVPLPHGLPRPTPLLIELPGRVLVLGLLLAAHPLVALGLAHLLVRLVLRAAPPGGGAAAALLWALVLVLGSEAIAAALRGELSALPGALGSSLRSLR